MHAPIYVCHTGTCVSVFVHILRIYPYSQLHLSACLWARFCVRCVCVCVCLHIPTFCLLAPSVPNLALIQRVVLCCCGVTGLTTFSFKIPVIRHTTVCSGARTHCIHTSKLNDACHTFCWHTETCMYPVVSFIPCWCVSYVCTITAYSNFVVWANDARQANLHTNSGTRAILPNQMMHVLHIDTHTCLNYVIKWCL